LGLFTTGLFGVLLHYVGQRDAEEEQLRRIREVIAGDLAANPDGLVALVSSETRDRIAENCLRLQLGDPDLARELYADLREQLIRTPERRYGMELSVALAPWADGPPSGHGAMFVATVRSEYRVTTASRVLRFVCVSDLDEYRESLQDPTCTVVHYFEPTGALDGESAAAFEFVECTVDGRPRPTRHATRTGTQIVTVHLGADRATELQLPTISFTYRVLVQQRGHLLHLDLSRPTKGLKVQFMPVFVQLQRVGVAPRHALGPVERLTREACEKLTRLREAEQAAAEAFCAALEKGQHVSSPRSATAPPPPACDPQA
jgi:hypothetical protein